MKMIDVGNRIAGLRHNAGLTQAQLAERIGVSETTIAAYEQGRRGKLDTLQAIATELRVQVEVLLGTGPAASERPEVAQLLHIARGLEPDAVRELSRLARWMAEGQSRAG